MRVAVWSGDNKTYLGEGELVGSVNLYCFRLEDGSLASLKQPENYPADELIAKMEKIGGVLAHIPSNPKIELDTGETIYGCQCWWKRL